MTEQLWGHRLHQLPNRVVIMQQLEDIDAAAESISKALSPPNEMNGIPVIYKFEVPELQVGERTF